MRSFTVAVIILTCVILQVYVTLTRSELYPFNPASMFSQAKSYKSFSVLRFRFIDKHENEFPVAPFHISPMDTQRLYVALDKIYHNDKDWQLKIAEAARTTYELYIKNYKVWSDPDKKMYNGFRIYYQRWSNKEAFLDQKPTSEKMIGEYLAE